MDESALRTLLTKLEASRSSLHGLLHVFTLLVLIGLAVDLAVILKEFSDGWKEFRYGHVHPYEIHRPARPSIWLLMLGLLGTALIVIGVWGEMYVDVKAAKVETNIKVASDTLLGLIIQEAGMAQTNARNASDDAMHAKEAAASVATTARELAVELSHFRAEAGARRLSAEQKKSLCSVLATTPGGVLGIGFNPFDQEASVFANDFVEAFKCAHWSAVRQFWTAWKPGLFIAFTSKEALDAPRVKLLREAVDGAHLSVENWQVESGDKSLDPPFKAGILYFLIGSHPPVSQTAKSNPGSPVNRK